MHKLPKIKGTLYIDWGEVACRKKPKYSGVVEMFRDMFASTTEELRAGKLSVAKLAKHFGVNIVTMSIALKKYGFATLPKSQNLGRPRYKYQYPFVSLGFSSDVLMWEYFVRERYTQSEIHIKFYDVTWKIFSMVRIGKIMQKTRRGIKNGQ